jgi:organic hydroperoxide reductase OsmC/OhrA
MQNFPHHYKVAASAQADGDVSVESDGLDPIPCAAPAQFGGPGNRWSPETLLVASVANCLILSFRAIARASKLPWTSLNCEVEGILEREKGLMKFTGFKIKAMLRVPPDTVGERAHRILHKAEESCLITNSLSGPTQLEAVILEGHD